MSEFNFGSRPITTYEGNISDGTIFFIAGSAVFATAKAYDDIFEVRGKKDKFLGTVSGIANACVIVCSYYDKLYPTTPKLQEVWVIFGFVSDREQEIDYSREIDAPDIETAKEIFLSRINEFMEENDDLSIRAIYGPYTRA